MPTKTPKPASPFPELADAMRAIVAAPKADVEQAIAKAKRERDAKAKRQKA